MPVSFRGYGNVPLTVTDTGFVTVTDYRLCNMLIVVLILVLKSCNYLLDNRHHHTVRVTMPISFRGYGDVSLTVTDTGFVTVTDYRLLNLRLSHF